MRKGRIIMKKTAAFLTAVFASLAMTAGTSAQNIVNDVVDGAEDIVNGAGNAVEDIVDGSDRDNANEGVVTDDVPGNNEGIEPLNDARPLADNPGTGVDLMTTGAVAIASAGAAYILKKRSIAKK